MNNKIFCFKHEAATNGEVSQEGKRERRRKEGLTLVQVI